LGAWKRGGGEAQRSPMVRRGGSESVRRQPARDRTPGLRSTPPRRAREGVDSRAEAAWRCPVKESRDAKLSLGNAASWLQEMFNVSELNSYCLMTIASDR
jgi:hypothetical protein